MKPAVFGLLFCLAPQAWGLTLWGVDINGVEIQSSLWSIQNSVEDGAPNPVVNTVGVSVPFRYLGRWTARAEAQLFFLGYKYQDGRAVPESSMWDNVTIMSLMINATGGYEFPLSPTLGWDVEGGLGFLARFPVLFNGKTAGEMALPVTSWLLAGRLIYPNGGSSITWQFSPLLAATLRAQLFYPIFDLWGGLPWYDELTYGVGIGIRFSL